MTSSRSLASAGPSGLALASDDAEGTIYLLSGMSMGNLVLASIAAAKSIVCVIIGLDPCLTLGDAAKQHCLCAVSFNLAHNTNVAWVLPSGIKHSKV